MPWVDRVLCLECGNVVEPVDGQLPEGPCQPEQDVHDGQCALVMAKVFEPDLVPGGGLFGVRTGRGQSQGPA